MTGLKERMEVKPGVVSGLWEGGRGEGRGART